MKQGDVGQPEGAKLQDVRETVTMCSELLFEGAYQHCRRGKARALLFDFCAAFFRIPRFANQALGVAAASYRQTQNIAKMLDVANGLLAKDPDNLGMLLLLADYYSEKGEQLDKAENRTPRNPFRFWRRPRSRTALPTSSGNSRAVCRRAWP